MNIKMLKAALAGLVLSVSGFANAGLIEFDFSGSGNDAVERTFTEGGLSVNVTALVNCSSCDLYSPALVTQTGDGLGVRANAADNPELNGTGSPLYDKKERLMFSFASDQTVTGIKFVGIDNGFAEYFDIQVWGIRGWDKDMMISSDGWMTVDFTGNGFSVMANKDGDYRIAGFRVGSADVPEPSSIAILGLGLAGLFVRRRRQS